MKLTLLEKLKSECNERALLIQCRNLYMFSRSKVTHEGKGHVRLICKVTENVKFDIFAYLSIIWNQVTPMDLASRSGVNLHHPQTATADDTCGPGTAK